MREKIKKILPIFLLIIAIVFPLVTDARSGCCSHHGGVCGCSCCDGTSLSATCAPYYPQCSRAVDPVIPESSIPTIPVSPKSESEIPKSDLPAEVPKNDNNYLWWGIIGLVAGGFITYLFLRRKK